MMAIFCELYASTEKEQSKTGSFFPSSILSCFTPTVCIVHALALDSKLQAL